MADQPTPIKDEDTPEGKMAITGGGSSSNDVYMLEEEPYNDG